MLRKILVGLVTLAIGLPLLALGLEAAMQARDDERYPPPGELVDIGSHKMHIYCRGEGGPTVVFDAGAGVISANFYPIIGELSAYTRACAFDRAGQGWSEEGPTPRSMNQLSAELKATLDGAGVDGPVVVAAHSIAGFHARTFAANYPDRVAGLVMIDTSHEEQWERLGLDVAGNTQPLFDRAFWGRFGYLRHAELVPPAPPIYAEEWHEAVYSRNIRHQRFRALGNERLGWPDSRKGNLPPRDLGDIPIIVLTSLNKAPNLEPEARQARIDSWNDMQRDMLNFSTDARQVATDQAGHYIHVDQPGLVVSAIRELVERARANAEQAASGAGGR